MDDQSILELQVDQTASKNLSEVSRWAKFLSITGFVFMGCMLIVFIAMRSQIASTLSQVIPGFAEVNSLGVLVAFFIIIAGIVFLLMYFLFRGSILIKKGIETKSQDMFNNGLASLKAYFMMYGILAIIALISNFVSIF
ncbi:MAG TPA: hypothetical protein VFD24_13140 [Chitinophagaceae bacterium]|jgi:hypothetical protein|nr:hypothetical protein [Chitinophagaceae bacterium]